jgi:hypothetical protein
VALVRVYCGLASADTGVAGNGGWLTAAVVDDSGRLLEVCEIGDDANGYATLSSLLAERSSAPSGVAVAADSDDHLVTMLLTTAGRPLAVVDDDAADDYAERFADDESIEEIESEPAERRAVGLARALQAGALSAQAGPAPRDLAGLKPVLSAHAALTHGRHGAAGALREVLRELYPAALRAYPDPAEPTALAILDLLPEPGLLAAPATGRNRDTALAVDSVAAQVAASGVADHASALEAVTALRVAIAESPRRGGVTKHLNSAIAETVRHAVAAVRSCDAACAALIDSVAERVTTPVPAAKVKRSAAAAPVAAPVAPPASAPLRAVREGVEPLTRIPAARRSRAPLTPVSAAPTSALPTSPAAPMSPAAQPLLPAPLPPGFEPTPAVGLPLVTAAAPQAAAQPQPMQAQQVPAPQPIAQPVAQPQATPRRVAQQQAAQPQPIPQPVAHPQPVHNAPSVVPAQRMPAEAPFEPVGQRVSPADTGAPFVPKLTQAAISHARAERLAPPAEPAISALDEQGAGASAAEIVFPLTRPVTPAAAEVPGARSTWPLLGERDEPAFDDGGYDAAAVEPGRSRYDQLNSYDTNGYESNGYDANGYDGNRYETNTYDTGSYDTGNYDKVTPPWLADDLVLPEPPALRLVDASALEEPLRERSRARRDVRDALDSSTPVADDGDGDLLIFSTIRSAWFTGPAEEAPEEEPTWNSEMDLGWRAAEHAAHPSISEETNAGLPKRVPQANLVPGSPIAAPERPLRIVRDPQRLAQHTSGYFRGWRRGQEVNGYAVGGRPGRESAGGWDFSRDQDERDDYGYRTAGYGR